MARYTMTLQTPKPADEVFDYLADISNFDDWDPGTKKATQVEGSGPGVGSGYDLVTGGTTLRYETTIYERPHRVEAVAQNRFIRSHDVIAVVAQGTGSVVTYDATLTLSGVLKVGDPILQVVFNRLGKDAAKGLADKLDGTRTA